MESRELNLLLVWWLMVVDEAFFMESGMCFLMLSSKLCSINHRWWS